MTVDLEGNLWVQNFEIPGAPDLRITHVISACRLTNAAAVDLRLILETGFDDELAAAIAGEIQRQEQHIELIASENYASPRVLQAQGSVLTNKYAEGYPGRRYYGGCEHVDVAGIERER